MEYSQEELWEVTGKLAEQYTSKESTSVSYDKARGLMEAVVYCIKEFEWGNRNSLAAGKADIWTAYRRGQEIVLEKVLKAKELYHKIIEDFCDFNCCCYRDTIQKGMSQFFIWYDAKYKPQDHLLTLDYPTIRSIGDICGIDAIYKYLYYIQLENNFLKLFDEGSVCQMLDRMMPDYSKLYMDNIAYGVLLNGIGCFAAQKPIAFLNLEEEDYKAIRDFFKENEKEKIEGQVKGILSILLTTLLPEDQETGEYFLGLEKEFSERIFNGLENHCLEHIFV